MISPEYLENQKPLIGFDSKPLNGLRGFVATHLVIFHSLWYSEYNINIYGTVILILYIYIYTINLFRKLSIIYIQWVLLYRDKCVKKFQKIPIFDHLLTLLTSNIGIFPEKSRYSNFSGKIPIFEVNSDH